MTFDTGKTISYWRETAAYDMETARVLQERARNPSALFFGHLALEKLLKALVVKATGTHAPLTHRLAKLASLTGHEAPPDFATDLELITEFNIEGRYPEDKLLLYAKCTPEFTAGHMARIEEIYRWYLARL